MERANSLLTTGKKYTLKKKKSLEIQAKSCDFIWIMYDCISIVNKQENVYDTLCT